MLERRLSNSSVAKLLPRMQLLRPISDLDLLDQRCDAASAFLPFVHLAAVIGFDR